jgi:hypothetical protein
MVVLLPILFFCILVPLIVAFGGIWTINNPSKQRCYFIWDEQDGVLGPMKFAEAFAQMNEDRLLLATHLLNDQWHPIHHWTTDGKLRRGAANRGIPQKRPAGLWAAFNGPQPPDFPL